MKQIYITLLCAAQLGACCGANPLTGGEREVLARTVYELPPAAYRQRSLSPDEREIKIEAEVERLLAELTLKEKVSLCHAESKFSVSGVPRLKLKSLWMSDGPHGVRKEIHFNKWMSANWTDDDATYLPVLSGVTASFNTEIAALHGTVLGKEARDRNKDIILGPGINMTRSPLCGRNFEYCGEDPYLAGKMGVAEIKAIQDQDVAACAKHYVLNSQEWNRTKVDTRPDERTLREIYLPAFEMAVKEGGVLSIMGAYNSYQGTNCNENARLLMDILKGEWGYKGIVLTDWGTELTTRDAALNGLDIEMGTRTKTYEEYALADRFLQMLKDGELPMSVLDDKVRRILRLELTIGMMDGARLKGERNTAAHRRAARTIAEESVVLLKNESKALPLDRHKIKNLLVLGHNADKQHAPGGMSSAIKCAYEITPLEGLRKKLGDTVEINFIDIKDNATALIENELVTSMDPGPGTTAWKITFLLKGEKVGEAYSIDSDITAESIQFMRTQPADQILLSGTVRPKTSDAYKLSVKAVGEARIFCDGKSVTDLIHLDAGTEVRIEVDYTKFFQKNASLLLGWKRMSLTDEIPDYIAAAKKADAVIYFGGTDHALDTEASDRPHMRSWDRDLPEQLLAVRPDTLFFMIGGSPIKMPWSDQAKTILWGWYGGMEGGNAYADILFGDVNPSGKLPITFPKKLSDSPAHALDDYKEDICYYKEGIFMGYRWFDHKKIEPLFPFGHGLSYTSFTYSDLKLSSETLSGDDTMTVSYTVTNTGNVAGKEVTQLYVQDVEASVERPVKELKGFSKVSLQPGESKTVTHTLNKRSLAFWDTSTSDWKAESGEFRVIIGASSKDLRLNKSFQYK